MKELTLLEKKLIVLLKYKIKSAFFESKIELEAIIEKN